MPAVQRRLAANDRRVEVMLGYSDSSKDVGPVAATLALDVAQARITRWAREHDITLTLFHGRGGALGRGGGPANRALLAQPPGSVDGRFKLTEQGEVIFARYGDPVIAARHIEQVAAATLLAGAPSVERRNAEATERFAELASSLDRASRARFCELVRADGFPQWFAQVTPLEEIGLLPLGSRPARRGLSVESLDDLRAIPWVFSWSQARTNLAGWFGLGGALDEIGDLAELRADRPALPRSWAATRSRGARARRDALDAPVGARDHIEQRHAVTSADPWSCGPAPQPLCRCALVAAAEGAQAVANRRRPGGCRRRAAVAAAERQRGRGGTAEHRVTCASRARGRALGHRSALV